jgi:hypothetical protein
MSKGDGTIIMGVSLIMAELKDSIEVVGLIFAVMRLARKVRRLEGRVP